MNNRQILEFSWTGACTLPQIVEYFFLHMNPDLIRQALTQVRYPGFSRNIVSFGMVKEITCEPGLTTVRLEVQTRSPEIPEKIFQDCHAVLDSLPEIGSVKIDIQVKDAPEQGSGGHAPGTTTGKSSIPGVKRIIAVASGKGGVGKSTVTSNLAIALAATGAKVGVCDCDLYGPSMGKMFGVSERPMANEHDEIIPLESFGIQMMSMSFLLEDRSPVIVRGPMATRYTQQFLRQVAWQDLDYLILDLPPGTGDIQLTIVQTVSVSGAIVVTTPQEVALIDARKGISMFEQVNVPILGIVENMSWFECDAGKKYYLFGDGGGVKEAAALNIPLLAQIPIDIATRKGGDSGTPVASLPASENKVSAAFHDLAASVIRAVPCV